jgi:hypothetical protein
VLIIIMAGLSLEIAGSNPDYHQITVIHQTEPISWNGYNVLSTKDKGGTTIVDIKPTQNDRETLISLFQTLKGNADGFFTTWNFYSYF